jgi:hypothetical protein
VKPVVPTCCEAEGAVGLSPSNRPERG